MLNIKQLTVNPLQENTFIVYDDTLEAVIIDCGTFFPQEHQALLLFLRTNGLKPTHLLCTHGHLDHCIGNINIFREYGLKPEVMADDEFLITELDRQASQMFGFTLEDDIPPVGTFLSDGDTIHFGNHQLRVIHTPGHTPGSCVFFCEQEHVAFTGDTLFHLSIGRTDFEQGSLPDMMKSLALLKTALPPETTLYTGHGPSSTMETEIRQNTFLRYGQA